MAKTKTPSRGKAHRAANGAGKAAVRREYSAGFLLYRATHGGGVGGVAGGGWKWLLLDYGRHWDYPKGHLEKGETAWQAAVRELREETGITQVDRVGRLAWDIEYAFFSPRKGHVRKTVRFFVGRTRTKDVALSDEHDGYAWLRYEEALARLTFGKARDLLRRAERAVRVARAAHGAAAARPAAP